MYHDSKDVDSEKAQDDSSKRHGKRDEKKVFRASHLFAFMAKAELKINQPMEIDEKGMASYDIKCEGVRAL